MPWQRDAPVSRSAIEHFDQVDPVHHLKPLVADPIWIGLQDIGDGQDHRSDKRQFVRRLHDRHQDAAKMVATTAPANIFQRLTCACLPRFAAPILAPSMISMSNSL